MAKKKLKSKKSEVVIDDSNYYNNSRAVVIDKKEIPTDFFLSPDDLEFLLSDCDSMIEQIEIINKFTIVLLNKDSRKILLLLNSFPILYTNQIRDMAKLCEVSLRKKLDMLLEIKFIKRAGKSEYAEETEALIECFPGRRFYFGQLNPFGYQLTSFGKKFIDEKFELLTKELDISFVKMLKGLGQGFQENLQKLIAEKKKVDAEEIRKLEEGAAKAKEEEESKIKCINCGIQILDMKQAVIFGKKYLCNSCYHSEGVVSKLLKKENDSKE